MSRRGRPQAAQRRRLPDALGLRRGVDREPVAARPAREQPRLVARQRERAAAVGRVGAPVRSLSVTAKRPGGRLGAGSPDGDRHAPHDAARAPHDQPRARSGRRGSRRRPRRGATGDARIHAGRRFGQLGGRAPAASRRAGAARTTLREPNSVRGRSAPAGGRPASGAQADRRGARARSASGPRAARAAPRRHGEPGGSTSAATGAGGGSPPQPASSGQGEQRARDASRQVNGTRAPSPAAA